MTTNEVTKELAENYGVGQKAVHGIINDYMSLMIKNATDEGKARFGKHIFKKFTRAAHSGRNPKTGEAIQIPASSRVVFKVKI